MLRQRRVIRQSRRGLFNMSLSFSSEENLNTHCCWNADSLPSFERGEVIATGSLPAKRPVHFPCRRNRAIYGKC